MIQRMLEALLRPIIKLWLQQGFNYHEFRETARWIFADVALNDPDFAIQGRSIHSQTCSHAAALTGLTRIEVTELQQLPGPSLRDITAETHRAIRLIDAWLTVPDYQDAAGRPLQLPRRGPAPSFEALCKIGGRDTPSRTLLDELLASGNVSITRKQVQLVNPLYVGRESPPLATEVLTLIASDFLHSVEQSCREEPRVLPRLREAFFHDISLEKVEAAKKWLHTKLQNYNDECNKGLARFRVRTKDEPSYYIAAGHYSVFRFPDENKLELVDQAKDA